MDAYKYLIILSCALMMLTSTLAESPADVGISRSTEGGWVYPIDIAVDDSGNVFVAGVLYNTVDFGGGVLTSEGFDDIFLVKFDKDGNHLWSNSFGDGMYAQYVNDIDVDNSGNVVIAGFFYEATLDFGGGPLDSYLGEAFVAKFDPDGNHIWSQNYGSEFYYAEAMGVAVNDLGHIIVTGEFRDTIDFGGGPLTAVGWSNIFVVEFDPIGNHIWSQRYGNLAGQGNSISIDQFGNVLLSGQYSSSVDFGCGQLEGANDIFITKLDSDSACIWSNSCEHSMDGFVYYDWLTTDNSGNVMITGYFEDTSDFGGGPLTSAGGFDIYIAKFDTNGNHLWSDRFGNNGDDGAHSIATDMLDNVIVTGSFYYYDIDFGGGNLINAGRDDVFLVKFDPNGNHLWSKSYGDSLYSSGRCVATDEANNIITAGDFYGRINLGGDTFLNTGDCDMYIAKLDSNGNHIWSYRFGNWYGTDVDDNRLELNFELSVYPNPFNLHTTISYTLHIPSQTILKVYDVNGRLVRTLLNEFKIPDNYNVMWDGCDSNHLPVASGIYFIHLESGGKSTTKKIVLTK